MLKRNFHKKNSSFKYKTADASETAVESGTEMTANEQDGKISNTEVKTGLPKRILKTTLYILLEALSLICEGLYIAFVFIERRSYYYGLQLLRVKRCVLKRHKQKLKNLLLYVPRMIFSMLSFILKGIYNSLVAVISTFSKPPVAITKAFILMFSNIPECLRTDGIFAAVKEFFRIIFKGTYHNRKIFTTIINYSLPVVAAFFLYTSYVHYSSQTFALQLEYDGNKIGYIANERTYDEAEKLLLGRLVDQNNSISSKSPSYKLAVINNDDVLDANTVADKMIEVSYDEITEATGLYISGKFRGAVMNGNHLQNKIDSILNRCKTGKGVETVSFVKEVKLIKGLYPVSSLTDEKSLLKIFNQKVEVTKKYKIVEGDAPLSIAKKNDISYSELISLNPKLEKSCLIGDEVIISQTEPLMQIQISRVETYDVDIPYESKTKETSSEYTSYKKVTTEGSVGKKSVTATRTYVNGSIVSTNVISEKILKEPTDEIITRGTKAIPSSGDVHTGSITGSSGSGSLSGLDFIWPIRNGRITCGYMGYSGHTGIDIIQPAGQSKYNVNVRAAEDGKVIKVVKQRRSYGNYIIIDHGNGVQTLYAHNESLCVNVGDRVSKGQKIAVMGDTGNANGRHCHFEIRVNGSYKNPRNYL